VLSAHEDDPTSNSSCPGCGWPLQRIVRRHRFRRPRRFNRPRAAAYAFFLGGGCTREVSSAKNPGSLSRALVHRTQLVESQLRIAHPAPALAALLPAISDSSSINLPASTNVARSAHRLRLDALGDRNKCAFRAWPGSCVEVVGISQAAGLWRRSRLGSLQISWNSTVHSSR